MTAGKAVNLNSDMTYTAATTRKIIQNDKRAPPVCMFALERNPPSISSNYFLIDHLDWTKKTHQAHIKLNTVLGKHCYT